MVKCKRAESNSWYPGEMKDMYKSDGREINISTGIGKETANTQSKCTIGEKYI